MKLNLIIVLLISIGITSCEFFGGSSSSSGKQVKAADGSFVQTKNFGNDPSAPVEWKVTLKHDSAGNTIRHGLSTRYSRGGKVYETINYQNNKKEGIRKTYHSTGKVYKEQNYENGKLNGICKRYDRDGKISAEYNYKKGLPGIGLVEYTNLGKVRKQPSLYIKHVDEVRSANRYNLQMSLTGEGTERIKSVTFYEGDLIEGKYFHKNLNPAKQLSTKKGEFSYRIARGQMLIKTFNIVAVAKTVDGLTLILQKKTSVSVRGV